MQSPSDAANGRPLPCQSAVIRFYNNLQDCGDCQNTRKWTRHRILWAGLWGWRIVPLLSTSSIYLDNSQRARLLKRTDICICAPRARGLALSGFFCCTGSMIVFTPTPPRTAPFRLRLKFWRTTGDAFVAFEVRELNTEGSRRVVEIGWVAGRWQAVRRDQRKARSRRRMPRC
jgi:hypothetical protein